MPDRCSGHIPDITTLIPPPPAARGGGNEPEVGDLSELRLEVLLEPERTGDSVAEVCRRRGISRETFYAYCEMVRMGRVDDLDTSITFRPVGLAFRRCLAVTDSVRKEDGVEGDRFEELKRKAAGAGLTDEEAAELGRLYAEERGEPYQDSSSVSDADASSENRESQERRERDAAAQAKATEER